MRIDTQARQINPAFYLTSLLSQAGTGTPEKQNEATTGFGSGRWLDPANNDKQQYDTDTNSGYE